MLTVTKSFSFCYGHRLPGYPGNCERYHGHNSTLEVEVREEPALHDTFSEDVAVGYPGMVCDFKYLKRIVGREVIEVLDHQDLNTLTDRMPMLSLCEDTKVLMANPTAENMVMWIRERLKRYMPGLVRIRLYETPNSYAEWKRV